MHRATFADAADGDVLGPSENLAKGPDAGDRETNTPFGLVLPCRPVAPQS